MIGGTSPVRLDPDPATVEPRRPRPEQLADSVIAPWCTNRSIIAAMVASPKTCPQREDDRLEVKLIDDLSHRWRPATRTGRPPRC